MADIGSISVSKLNEYIKYKLEGDLVLRGISVEGEISNCKTYSSGHMYFTLKDRDAAVKCVMFRGYRQTLDFEPADGDGVIVKGDVSVYTKEGSYQLYATGIRREGMGALFEKYLMLKAALEKEGLFDAEHKKAIPKYPEKIGVVTSSSGAVFHDIMNVSKRRYPLCEIKLYPSRVQGEDADEELIAALNIADKDGCDTIIIARGGGSIEDLWQFNSEKLARAIYFAETPIISGVGHETDFTICDFVSDLRAPTPSAAAELALPDSRELRMKLSAIEDRLISAVMSDISVKRSYIERYSADLKYSVKDVFGGFRSKIDGCEAKLGQSIKMLLNDKRSSLKLVSQRISLNDPITIMNKGYSCVIKDKERIRSASGLTVGDKVRLVFADGEHSAKIIEGETDE